VRISFDLFVAHTVGIKAIVEVLILLLITLKSKVVKRLGFKSVC